jgi:hypothetical protein
MLDFGYADEGQAITSAAKINLGATANFARAGSERER